ncbi:MAG: outer membrane beta-barrel protein [Vicinamibacterales bacterium]
MSRARTAVFLMTAALSLPASTVAAQTVEPASRLELGAGVRWIGAEQLGARTATETTGAGGTSALFNTSTDLAGAGGIDGRVAVRLSRSLAVEAEASYLKPQLRIAISGDAEGAAAVTAVETIQQFTMGGSLIWRLPGRRWSPRFAPFATAGAGYLRQLHEQGTLVDTGHYYQFGAGVSSLLVATRRLHTRGIGVRADVRGLVRSMGVTVDGASKVSPAAGASLFVRF